MGKVIRIFNSRTPTANQKTDDPNNILDTDEIFWVCSCGSSDFFLTPHGAKCKGCGLFTDLVDIMGD